MSQNASSLGSARRRALVSIVLALLACPPLWARSPRSISPASMPASSPPHRRHWAFQKVTKPVVPAVKDAAWVRNPIDAFILARLEAKGWQPSAPAPSPTLLRRVHLDLTGLPPTIAEQDAFARNPDLDAVAKGLLGRPTYGERWARHWLDVARYAESAGYERDAAKPHVWRYRDYVIRAFNDDKPFDRFILEQIAGDELPDTNAETLIATGFHRLGPWDDEPADPAEDRFDQLDDMIGTTSLAFLGLTMGCARCHNHKFEALTMHDYYRMVAIFDPLQRPRSGRTELDSPIGGRTELDALAARDRRIAELRKSTPKDGQAELEARIAALKKETPDLPRGYFMTEPPGKVPVTHLLVRGKAARPGPEVQPGFPAVLVDKQPTFPAPERTSLRRLTLAKWIAGPENPLTARVIVNRVWHYHFGQGIVRTPSDFGTAGQAPTHPELLDWLASWFVENGWSIKKLHALIVASNTYRMSKAPHAEYAKADPDNTLFWRFPYRRLEAEAIRDSALAVSGRLNPKMYGPSVFLPIPKEALAGNSDLEKVWKVSSPEEASRRTVYAFVKRALVVPMLEVLDVCDTTRSSDKRLVTTVAPQALNLFNGDFVQEQSRFFAERLRKEAGDDPERQIDHAFRLALARLPSARERAAIKAFLDQQAKRFAAEAPDASAAQARCEALTQVCRVIFNLNEFVYAE
ncbi:MAG: DUF1549 and DUF1553 domain-containing protein [Gemmataceae bacterium]